MLRFTKRTRTLEELNATEIRMHLHEQCSKDVKFARIGDKRNSVIKVLIFLIIKIVKR